MADLALARSARPPALGQPEGGVEPLAITEGDRAAMARLENAIDARIDAALVLADTLYVTQTKVVASVVAVGNEANLNAVRLVRDGQAKLTRDRAHFRLA